MQSRHNKVSDEYIVEMGDDVDDGCYEHNMDSVDMVTSINTK